MKPRAPDPGRLDHDLYTHRRALQAGGSAWPGGRRSAAFVLLHVESVELDPPSDALRDPRLRGDFGNFFPDYRTHSYLEYGNRIGVFRLLDWLQPRGWAVAAAVNGIVARDKPALVRELARREVALLAGGWSASRMVSSAMPAAAERDLLQRTIDAIAQITGARPAGYASQDYGYSTNTPALLEDFGFTHAVDWPNDEIPFRFGPGRRVVMLSVAAELDDAHAMVARKLQPALWGRMLADALDHWHAHALPGSVWILSLHPWVAGAAHRFPSLCRALAERPAEAFWQARPEDIVAAWRERDTSS
jgi:hypothetical protein